MQQTGPLQHWAGAEGDGDGVRAVGERDADSDGRSGEDEALRLAALLPLGLPVAAALLGEGDDDAVAEREGMRLAEGEGVGGPPQLQRASLACTIWPFKHSVPGAVCMGA